MLEWTRVGHDAKEIGRAGLSSASTLNLTHDKSYDIFLEPCDRSQHHFKYREVSIVYRNGSGDCTYCE